MRAVQAWQRFFFEPRTTAPMTLVRIAWGSVMVVWALSLLPDVDPFLTTGALRYDQAATPGHWNPLEWTTWAAAPLAACLLLLAAALATAVGYRTRLSAVVAVVCLTAIERTNPTIFNSGDLFLRQIGIAVALSPCGLLWSLDARHDPTPAANRAPWALRLLQLNLAIGYLLSGWEKVRGTTWRNGTALSLALRIDDLQRVRVPEWVLRQADVLTALTWGTLAFEGAFILLVWNRRLRPWVLGMGVALHLGIDVFLDVGYFSIAIWVAYLAFVLPETADRIVAQFTAPVRFPVRSSADRAPAQVPLAVEPAE